MPTKRASARLEMRMTPAVKARLQRAADRGGDRSLTAYMIRAATVMARSAAETAVGVAASALAVRR